MRVVVIAFVRNEKMPGVMNQMLVYMGDNQASGDDAALEFLLTKEDVWSQWVPKDVANKVKKSLD